MRKKLLVMTTILIFGLGGMAGADTVQLDLLSLGCPTEFNFDLSGWQQDFDLGITFTEISHVYIDWSGGITAGMVPEYDSQTGEPTGELLPLDVGLGVTLRDGSQWRHGDIYGGETTYPAAELFDQTSEFVYGHMPWSELFDGQARITVGYEELVVPDRMYAEHGSITLDSATLVVEGTVPEPGSILLMMVGLTFVRHKRRTSDSAQ